MTIRNLIPMILAIILVGLIFILLLLRIQNPSIWDGSFVNFDVIFALVYLVWIAFEMKVSKAEMRKGKTTSDFGTCEFYALGQAAVFLSALWLQSVYASPSIYHVLGFIIFLTGIVFRQWAVQTLGKTYSHIVRDVGDYEIIASGPYRYIRHPAYAGMILANVGVVIFFFNVVTLILFLLVLVPAIVLRIFVEEKTLFKIEAYRSYAQDRNRLIPGVW